MAWSARFLSEHDWKQISLPNNAFAARKVAQEGDPSQAAIAGEYAGRVYGLEVLKKPVNQSETNSTRFIIITNQKIFRKDAKKVSICFEIPHESGSLYHMLSHFIYNNLNLTKIESRPLKTVLGEYFFIIDCDYTKEKLAQFALEELTAVGIGYKILGAYQVYEI